MPVCCCIKNCKNTKRKKDSKIIYHRFPFKNENIMKYWIAATGRDNWFPYSDARICSLHFICNDYYNIDNDQKRYLRRHAIPTQNVHANILKLFQQNNDILEEEATNQTNNDYDAIIPKDEPNNDILEEEATNRATNDYDAVILKDEPNNDILEEEATNRITNDYDAIILKDEPSNILEEQATTSDAAISKCSNCNNLLLENKKLQKIIEDLKISQDARLNQQAGMFHTLMRKNETALKQKLEAVGKKNKVLNKNIKRKKNNITNLKTAFKLLKKQEYFGK